MNNPDFTIYSHHKWYEHITKINNDLKGFITIIQEMRQLPEPQKEGECRVRSDDSRILVDVRDWFFSHLNLPVYRVVLRTILNYVIAKLDYDRHAESLAIGFFQELVKRGYGRNQKEISSPYWK
jgi:hypothetical protein